MLLLTERRDYFFYLYVVGVAGQLWLTLLALLHYPDAQHLEPVPGSDEAAYEVGYYECHTSSQNPELRPWHILPGRAAPGARARLRRGGV